MSGPGKLCLNYDTNNEVLASDAPQWAISLLATALKDTELKPRAFQPRTAMPWSRYLRRARRRMPRGRPELSCPCRQRPSRSFRRETKFSPGATTPRAGLRDHRTGRPGNHGREPLFGALPLVEEAGDPHPRGRAPSSAR